MLLKSGYAATATDLHALISRKWSYGALVLLEWKIRPCAESVRLLIQQDQSHCIDMILEPGLTSFKQNDLSVAMKAEAHNVAALLVSKGGLVPDASHLAKAIQDSWYGCTKQMLLHGVQPTVADIVQATKLKAYMCWIHVDHTALLTTNKPLCSYPLKLKAWLATLVLMRIRNLA